MRHPARRLNSSKRARLERNSCGPASASPLAQRAKSCRKPPISERRLLGEPDSLTPRARGKAPRSAGPRGAGSCASAAALERRALADSGRRNCGPNRRRRRDASVATCRRAITPRAPAIVRATGRYRVIADKRIRQWPADLLPPRDDRHLRDWPFRR